MKHNNNNHNNNIHTSLSRGFTIVELLIVIVVIGILASITIVAYNGDAGRAGDVAVQADLRNLAGKIMEYNIVNGQYPGGNYDLGITGIPVFHVNRSVYKAIYGGGNLFYCTGNINAKPEFYLLAKSKSETVYTYSSVSGAGTYVGSWGGYPTLCPAVGMASYSTAYGFYQGTDGGWYDWTK